MSGSDSERSDDCDIAAGFTLAGLAGSTDESLVEALRSEDVALWRTGPIRSWFAESYKHHPAIDASDFRVLVHRTASDGDFPGVRLARPLGLRGLIGRGPALAREILSDPRYEAAGRVPARESGLAGFSIGSSTLLSSRQGPAFSWPLRIYGNEATLARLSSSNAVSRGLAELIETGSEPAEVRGVFADIVDFVDHPGEHEVLALRFGASGQHPAVLRDTLNLDQLDWSEPAVLFPLDQVDPASRLTDFVYGLSHNLPLDVAAWQATQRDEGLSPLVIASRNTLAQARVSDTIPLLRQRLEAFDTDQILPLDLGDLQRFFPGMDQVIDTTQPATVDTVQKILWQSNRFDFAHESDAAMGIAAVSRAADVAAAGRRPAGSGVRAPPAAGGEHEGPPPGDPPPGDEDDKSTTPSGPKVPRYTDVILLDPEGTDHNPLDPLLAGRTYALDVAIRGKRRGLTRERDDQRDTGIPDQTDTASVWVVISDETEGDDGTEAPLFELPVRFAELKLPVTGDSDAVRLDVTPLRTTDGEGTGLLGIRLYHKLILIDHIQLRIRVAADSSAPAPSPRPAIEPVLKHPGRKAVLEALDPTSAPRALTISVSRAAAPDTYLFAFVAGPGGDGVPQLTGTRRLTESELNGFVGEFREALLDLVFGPALAKSALAAEVKDAFLVRAAELGSRIFASLFNYQEAADLSRLGDMVRETLDDTAIVQVALSKDAADFVFPWQILAVDPERPAEPADPANLWGFRFVIEVKRCGDAPPPSSGAAAALAKAQVDYAYWKFGNEAEHRRKLDALVRKSEAAGRAVERVEPPIDSVAGLLAAFERGGGNLLYIYAHGTAAVPATPTGLGLNQQIRSRIEALGQLIDQDVLGLAGEELEEARQFQTRLSEATAQHRITALTLQQSDVPLARFSLLSRKYRLTRAPVVIVNTCESAQLWNAIGDSFVGLFLARGARAVLGTESTIPVVLADAFGETVLTGLFDGRPIGEAVRGARCDLLERCNNPLGLAYTLYGAADARLFPMQQGGGR